MEEKNAFNTTSLTFQLFQTDEAFTVNGRKYKHTHRDTHILKARTFEFICYGKLFLIFGNLTLITVNTIILNKINNKRTQLEN